MSEGQPLLPPPPLVFDDSNQAEQVETDAGLDSAVVKKASRSIRDFFGKKNQSSAIAQVEQDSKVARQVSAEQQGVTSDLAEHSTRTIWDDTEDAPLEADTSATSITIVEPTGSKRKAPSVATTGAQKRNQSRKITDEDAEMKEMAAAAKKKQKGVGKVVPKRGKNGAFVTAENENGIDTVMAGPSTQPAGAPKKRGRPKKQPPAPALEIIDISSPLKPKPPAPLVKKRGRPPKPKTSHLAAEELDLTVTEEEDEVSVIGHSQKGSQSSMSGKQKGKKRLDGTSNAEGVAQVQQGEPIQIDDDDVPMRLGNSVPTTKTKTGNTATTGKPIHSFFAKPKPASFNVDQLPSASNELTSADPQPFALPHTVSSCMPNPTMDSSSQALSIDFQILAQADTSTSEPVHNLFSAKSKKAPAQVHTPATPIETANPFFTSAPNPIIGKPGWATRTTTVKEPLWPSADEIDQPSEYAIERPRLDLPKRARQRVGLEQDDDGFWARLMPKSVVDLDDDAKGTPGTELSSVDEDYATHPAITSLPAKAASGGKTQLWVDKYRPLNHTEVLGNEVPAKYLVDWLNELAIGIKGEVSEERRRVQRKVIKTRRKQPKEDDWIVEDDEPIRDEGPDDESFIDDVQSAQRTGYPDLGTKLTNSILLQGPYGSGKTASIYAAAAELGWEVFEVYPGIGKRSGAHLTQLVGDVGKNHMVGKGRPTMPPSPAPEKAKHNPLFQAFAKASGKTKPAQVASARDSVDLTDSPVKKPREEMDFGFVAQAAEIKDAKPGGPDVRQSLILLEEVDILYEEDKGFWPAVVSLIEESKRPVIMTCNDLAMIPFEELALQTTLLFSPPKLDAAKALLTGIAATEGETVSSRCLDSLLQVCQLQAMDPIVFNKPLLPHVGRWPLGVDLRAALFQFQLEVSHNHARSFKTLRKPGSNQPVNSGTMQAQTHEDRDKELRDLLAVSRMTNALSSVDADIARRASSIMELNDPDHYKPSEDDEMGFHALLKPLPLLETQILPMLSREDEIASTVKELALHSAGKESWMDDSLEEGLGLARQQYQQATLAFLDPLIPLESHLLPSPILFLDFIPAISWMTHIDDALQAADLADAAAGRTRVNRRTGREMRITSYFSGNQAYVRQMPGGLKESELQAVRDCRLDLIQFNRLLVAPL